MCALTSKASASCLGSNALAKGYQEKQCTGAVKVIASIEDPAVIRQILGHLQNRT